MIPYLDMAGLRRRSVYAMVRPSELDVCEQTYPGAAAQSLRGCTDEMQARLRKGYGASPTWGNSLQFGKLPPPLNATGTLPPGVTFVGAPVLGCLEVGASITTAGPVGTAVFKWTARAYDPVPTYVSGVVTGALVALAGTGLSLAFPAGAYSLDNVYQSETAVPEVLLRWLSIMVYWEIRGLLGFKPNDPTAVKLEAAHERCEGFLREVADGVAGLFDIPTSADGDSARTTARVNGYSEQSPYTSMSRQGIQGSTEDNSGVGS